MVSTTPSTPESGQWPLLRDLFDDIDRRHDSRAARAIGVEPRLERNLDTGPTTVGIVYFKPDDLYDIYPAPFTFIVGARRTHVTGTWGGLCRFLGRSIEGDPRYYDPNLAKRAGGAWVAGTYHGGRGHEFDLARELVSTRVLVFDVDEGDPHQVAESLAAYSAIIHTTFKHRPHKPRCRLVLLLSEPVTTAWAFERGVKLDFTTPGKPTENGFVESFQGRFRDECLNAEIFHDLEDAKRKIRAWRDDYNRRRPHSALGNLSPREYLRRWYSEARSKKPIL